VVINGETLRADIGISEFIAAGGIVETENPRLKNQGCFPVQPVRIICQTLGAAYADQICARLALNQKPGRIAHDQGPGKDHCPGGQKALTQIAR
jgi:hypothetical protein